MLGSSITPSVSGRGRSGKRIENSSLDKGERGVVGGGVGGGVGAGDGVGRTTTLTLF